MRERQASHVTVPEPATVRRRPDRAEIVGSYPFALDHFQLEAIDALDAGHHVVVAAPTGSGKTVVAEYGIETTRRDGRRAFYTAPLKALSNQKFRDLSERYGAGSVGLLTGDNAINGDAPIVVMTTEVLRNMIYAGSPALDDLGLVVLDEVHFLQDTYRGPVWEEVIVHLPAHVRLVCLSATVSNTGGAGGVDPDRPRPDDAGRRAAPAGAPRRLLPRRATARTSACTCWRRSSAAVPTPTPCASTPRRSGAAGPRATSGRPAAAAGGCSPRRAGWRPSSSSSGASCCRRSCSSSAATSATRRPGRASPPACA